MIVCGRGPKVQPEKRVKFSVNFDPEGDFSSAHTRQVFLGQEIGDDVIL